MTLFTSAPESRDYPIQRWVFEDAAGRFDIDLGDSNMVPGRLDALNVPAGLELDYGHDRGLGTLREAVAGLYGGSADSVLITLGAQQALYLVYAALLTPGSRVIAFRPGWQQSWDVPPELGCQVDLVGFRPDLGFDVEAAEAVAGPDVRLIVANSPCNPTGRRIAEKDLNGLLALAERTGAYLLLDEEYALDLSRSAAVGSDRVISVSSLSKVYGFPGLRVGWLYGPQEVVERCARRKFLSTISNSVLCETLAVDVLAHREDHLRNYHELTRQGLAIVRDFARRNADAVTLVEPEDTPFAWLWLTTGEAPLAMCRRALDLGVLLMPGETLGASDGFRICFARSPEAVTEGLSRVERVLRPTSPAAGPAPAG
ncbi:aminotransferase class I/II-fold pyridoxal phosphate-dependent enzyme [Streptomyces sp. Je 1-79]|uniref:aminotransferase class I/II-fold pyridoxal phosphate-dependent enzyme n=1 Tax=Streptomyces sp. Je 1-79 TaxID=2943847 RepID=UPI0021A69ABF|nr:aminotransferase class I/II-fold pyridoxal phosphate-dependent enzyme [Streptomyces sp. Je 1-79]MCT4353758.1 aminotransferase class I/II-fold pyridoxal phosphate-dependent enzyme [Streptomyces sp. Je 1-79]